MRGKAGYSWLPCYVGRTLVVRGERAAGLDVYSGGTLITNTAAASGGAGRAFMLKSRQYDLTIIISIDLDILE
jgi:hypothetical protein